MRWFRHHTRQTAGLAIFALVLQLILSLGHTHGRPYAADAKGTAFAGIREGSTEIPVGPGRPDGDDRCLICASIALAGTLVLPAPPAAHLPLTIESAWLPPTRFSSTSRAGRFSFRARAPPVRRQGDALQNRCAVA